MIGLAHPALIHLVALFPAIAGAALLLYARRRRQAAEALGDSALVRRLAGAELGAVPNARIALVTLAALMLGVAAVGPTWGTEVAPREETRGDVVLVLDASASMLVEDVSPNRLELQRQAAYALLERLRGSRVGLVVFAGQAYALAPLTTDFGALDLYLDAVSPEVLTQGGSSLSDAVRQGVSLLAGGGAEGPSGSVVLVSDGDALEEEAAVLEAARLAARAGVPVHTVGVGTPRGGPVPDVEYPSGRRRGWKTEPATGEVAVSRRGDELLREVARRTGGFFHAVEDAAGAARLPAELTGTVGRGTARTSRGTVPGNRYEWFLGAGLLLLLLDSWIAAREGRRRASFDDGERVPVAARRRRRKMEVAP